MPVYGSSLTGPALTTDRSAEGRRRKDLSTAFTLIRLQGQPGHHLGQGRLARRALGRLRVARGGPGALALPPGLGACLALRVRPSNHLQKEL